MRQIQISMQDVSFGYERDRQILKRVSLEMGAQESIGIIGANGAGKSTLLKLLVGLYTGFEGRIRVAGIPVEKRTLPQIREKTGYVFQDSDSQLFMATVYDDVAFAPRSYGFSEEEVSRRVERALGMVNIPHLKERHTYRLSGGEKKLASIATILSLDPDIILMDEPSVALDPKNRRNLIHILNGFSQLKVIASHDLDFVMDTCQRVILLNNGQVVRDGKAGEILKDEDLLLDNALELPLGLGRRERKVILGSKNRRFHVE